MNALARTDNSLVSRWWWTVDRWSIAAIALLIGFGALLIMAASPAVADRLGLDSFHFVRRQFIVLPLALAVMLGVSLMSPRGVRRMALAGFGITLALLAATFAFGVEVKGAQRWIEFAGISLQPSEFIKPTFAVVAAWLFAERLRNNDMVVNSAAIGLFVLVVALLLMQPDFGMTVVVSAVWFTQFFLAGLPLIWVGLFLVLGVVGTLFAYFLLPHVASRIDRFLDPASGDSYQMTRSMEAFMKGGMTGRGPGEGTVKAVLPDAHTDFIFAVAGEELGLFACLIIVALFAFVVLRGFSRVLQEHNMFIMLTLPFISYGGSSLLAIAFGIGIVLALTRRRAGAEAL
ncbi:MAG: FtsW/RodA/SpoVE family cell cycle protein [Alphaproteobacteria bacterium]